VKNDSEENEPEEIIVTCEAKGKKDDILEDQILAQVNAIFKMPGITQDTVIPIAVKAIRPSEIQLVQFNTVRRDQLNDLDELKVVAETLYQLVPEVPGIGK